MTKDEQLQILAKALVTIAEGSAVTGRWLDAKGAECDEGDPDATWTEYDDEDQTIWISYVLMTATKALEAAGFGHMVGGER